MEKLRQRSSLESLGLRFALPLGSVPKHFSDCKVLGCERAVFLCDVRNIASPVVHPNSFRLVTLGKEDHIRLGAGAVRRESTFREAKHGVKIAIFRQNFEASPARSANKQLSGTTTAARPSGFRIVMTC